MALHKSKRGLRLPISGEPTQQVEAARTPIRVALLGADYPGMRPTMHAKVGETVKRGQCLCLTADSDACCYSPVSGKLVTIQPQYGDFGQRHIALTIEPQMPVDEDEALAAFVEQPTLETLVQLVPSLPGGSDLRPLIDAPDNIHTIVIMGADQDLMVKTQRHVVTTYEDSLKAGIRVLKEVAGVDRIVLVTARDATPGFGHIGAEMMAVNAVYPAASPALVANTLKGEILPAGKSPLDAGMLFLSAEAVHNLGLLVQSGRFPATKLMTVITKDQQVLLVEATIGTPIQQVLARTGQSLHTKDRLIQGGPMTGSALYSEALPVTAGTDALMVQDHASLPLVSDYPCVNCGDCVRVCPTRIAVNMLIRFLEAGQYEAAADEYDLWSCIDCGLCSYVCPSRIPILQYIKLGKYELDRISVLEEEESDDES